MYFSSSDSTE